MEFMHITIVKIMLNLIYICHSRSQLSETMKIISLRPTVVSEGFKMLVAEVVEKVEELQ